MWKCEWRFSFFLLFLILHANSWGSKTRILRLLSKIAHIDPFNRCSFWKTGPAPERSVIAERFVQINGDKRWQLCRGNVVGPSFSFVNLGYFLSFFFHLYLLFVFFSFLISRIITYHAHDSLAPLILVNERCVCPLVRACWEKQR